MIVTESPFPPDAFSRIDESDDSAFYATDRLVSHLDSTALETVVDLVERLAPQQGARILDLMASWDSHIPESFENCHVTGLGLNHLELEKNTRLAERVLHDLNANPVLPFEGQSFDVVLCTVSVDYLTQPLAVFREVARVLKPGGLFLVIFSNRFFPPKVVQIWREANEEQRIEIVTSYFQRSEGFEVPRVYTSKGKPRPKDDRYADMGLPSDPIFAVFADRRGGAGSTRELPGIDAGQHTNDPEVLRQRKKNVARTLECPHCLQPLAKWQVPQTPFVEWSSVYQFICFNDDCPHYVRGWTTFANQRIPGSHRFMYDPDTGGCHSVPVLTPEALRASIVSAEDPHDQPGVG